MAYLAYRPNSSNLRKVKKQRVNTISEKIDEQLKNDRWATIYTETFKPKTQEQKDMFKIASKTIKNTQINDQSKPEQKAIQSKLIKKRPLTSYQSGSNKNAQTSQIDNSSKNEQFCDKNTNNKTFLQPKNEHSISNNFFKNKCFDKSGLKKANISIEPVISQIKANSNVFNEKKQLSKNDEIFGQSIKKQLSHRNSSKIATSDELLTIYPELQNLNRITPFQNIIGQEEEWMDVHDKVNLPAYSRLINYNKDNFLKLNIKNLLQSKNEYYPFLKNQCLCGKCACGDCKCMHFRYKRDQNHMNCVQPSEQTTEYKKEYIPKKMEKNEHKIQPNEILIMPTKIDYSTINSVNFCANENVDLNCHPFLLKAKINNLGPNVCFAPCSMSENTSSRNDYPNWNCVGSAKIQPYIPNTVVKNLPWMGKPVNREYGSHHKNGELVESRKACIPESKNNIVPFVQELNDMQNETDYQRNFKLKTLGDDPLRKFLPVDNLQTDVFLKEISTF